MTSQNSPTAINNGGFGTVIDACEAANAWSDLSRCFKSGYMGVSSTLGDADACSRCPQLLQNRAYCEHMVPHKHGWSIARSSAIPTKKKLQTYIYIAASVDIMVGLFHVIKFSGIMKWRPAASVWSCETHLFFLNQGSTKDQVTNHQFFLPDDMTFGKANRQDGMVNDPLIHHVDSASATVVVCLPYALVAVVQCSHFDFASSNQQ